MDLRSRNICKTFRSGWIYATLKSACSPNHKWSVWVTLFHGKELLKVPKSMLWGICFRQRTYQHCDRCCGQFSFTQSSYHQMSLLCPRRHIALIGKKFLGVGVHKKRWLLIAWRLFSADIVLAYCDASLPIRIACDAADVGIGAVFLIAIQTRTSGRFQMYQWSWRAVNANGQIHKEALAIYFNHRSQAFSYTFWTKQA